MVSRTILSRVRLPIPPLGHLLSTLFILTHIFLVVHRKNQKWEDYFLPTLNYYNISDLKLVPFSSFSIPNISSIVADISANVSLVPKLTFDFIFLPYALLEYILLNGLYLVCLDHYHDQLLKLIYHHLLTLA